MDLNSCNKRSSRRKIETKIAGNSVSYLRLAMLKADGRRRRIRGLQHAVILFLRHQLTLELRPIRPHSSKNSMKPPTRPVRQPLRHGQPIHLPDPRGTDPPRVLRIHNLLDVEASRRPHRIHQPYILILQLLIPSLHTLRPLFLPDLFEFVAMADFNAAVEGQGAPVAARPRDAHPGFAAVEHDAAGDAVHAARDHAEDGCRGAVVGFAQFNAPLHCRGAFGDRADCVAGFLQSKVSIDQIYI